MLTTLGVIAPTYDDSAFGSLTQSRNISMLPYGCRYRFLDFPLSNMTDHGIRTVAIYPGKKIRSHMDHLAMGAPWNLNRRFNGLFLFPPTVSEDAINKYGEMAEFKSTADFFERSREENVLYYRSGILNKVDLSGLQATFRSSGADAAVVYRPVHDADMEYIGMQRLFFDEEEHLENLGYHYGSDVDVNLYMNLILLKKDAFRKLVRLSMERGDVSTMEDALFKYRQKFEIIGYKYDGFFDVINNIKNYYDANMRLLDPEHYEEVFYRGGKIYTKTKDEPSSFYTQNGSVKNSLLANGSVIYGSVENSLIFRGVTIEAGATVKNSIIMQKCCIRKDAVVVNSILDKFVTVGEGEHLIGSAQQPYVLQKNQRIEADE
ncbi:Glucose-1-phosphate adenylyltransferase [Aedoeadaptatus ivorii]|uniref:Glucose-1-phosphate adenylyltransferase n=1 Tax=Aedoeadaptatus ivorii TaxID=54006 RepID=A0A3S4Z2W9_9FIRM|nr:glucose-1-phosphate adenylyltransferase subunit GlgD [Peptoniphilus ivorii]MDQ0508574.1 glucose-1-phosphate adenylyltransferase [Peptoniphilus ivorii]VEJ34463.1 Glucose-1-phosphate adenylyltransferase [Peptoniphilus ivorii]